MFQLAKKLGSHTSKILLENRSATNVINTIHKDIKAKGDKLAHEYITKELAQTEIPVFSEEGHSGEFNSELNQWIIDPLDGTLNFTRGFEMACVSIALWNKGEPVFGVIHDIYHDVRYAGGGEHIATRNEKEMHVSGITQINNAVLATGFPSGAKYDDESLMEVVKKVQAYKKVRMLGSAALMMAQVAAGHFDIYEENDIYIWDVAAGMAIVKAAGGQVTWSYGSKPNMVNCRASNGLI